MGVKLFACLLFVGLLMHLRRADEVAHGDGIFWLWKSVPKTIGEHYARYSFYVWLGSCLLAFAPIDLRLAGGISCGVMFLHTIILSYRSAGKPTDA
jgi:hypothetical protein